MTRYKIISGHGYTCYCHQYWFHIVLLLCIVKADTEEAKQAETFLKAQRNPEDKHREQI